MGWIQATFCKAKCSDHVEILKYFKFHIVSVDVHIGKPDSQNWYEGKQKQKRAKMIADIKKNLSEANMG